MAAPTSETAEESHATVRSADPLRALALDGATGNAAAIRTLLASVAPSMLRTVRGVLGVRHPEVEDVAQEAAIGLVQALSTFRGECTVLHFACRIAVLTALAARRRLRVRGEGRGVDADVDEEPSAGPTPPDALAAARRRQLLRDLCDTLPASQGEALVLHHVLGLSITEVADACGVPGNTIRSRLRLAKEALRAKITSDARLAELLEVAR